MQVVLQVVGRRRGGIVGIAQPEIYQFHVFPVAGDKDITGKQSTQIRVLSLQEMLLHYGKR